MSWRVAGGSVVCGVAASDLPATLRRKRGRERGAAVESEWEWELEGRNLEIPGVGGGV